MELEFIKSLLHVAEDALLSELEYREHDNRLTLRFSIDPPQKHGISAVPGVGIDRFTSVESEAIGHACQPATVVHQVTSPLVGVFYLSSAPGHPAFVSVGALVKEGQTLAIVEAMKMLNAIEADCSGRIREILVSDGASVETGQILFTIEEEA